MELNMISAGLEIVGTTIKKINIDNNIVDIDYDGKRSFGININEPRFNYDNTPFGQLTIDFELEITQSDDQKCIMELSIEGAFLGDSEIKKENFEQLVIINGAAALIGIARGKIESISASMFNSGKIVIPFVNVVDYYKHISE